MQSGHFAPATLKCLLSLDLNISSEDLIMKQAPQITILFPITFFSKTWEIRQAFLYQCKCRSEKLIQAFTLDFFQWSQHCILEKMCYVGQSIFWHACYCCHHQCHFVVIHQNADSKGETVLKVTCPSSLNFKASLCIMTALFHDIFFMTCHFYDIFSMSVLKAITETLLHLSICFIWMIKTF